MLLARKRKRGNLAGHLGNPTQGPQRIGDYPHGAGRGAQQCEQHQHDDDDRLPRQCLVGLVKGHRRHQPFAAGEFPASDPVGAEVAQLDGPHSAVAQVEALECPLRVRRCRLGLTVTEHRRVHHGVAAQHRDDSAERLPLEGGQLPGGHPRRIAFDVGVAEGRQRVRHLAVGQANGFVAEAHHRHHTHPDERDADDRGHPDHQLPAQRTWLPPRSAPAHCGGRTM